MTLPYPAIDAVFHFPKPSVNDWRGRNYLAIYEKLEKMLLDAGGTVEVMARDPKALAEGAFDGDRRLHFVENGNIQRTGILNAGLAYIPPYWHLDPKGVLADSSNASKVFDPNLVPWQAAKRHFDRLTERFVQRRHSRYAQRQDVEIVPKDAIAVFLQGTLPHERGTAFCTPIELLRAVAQGAGGRPIIVKPHPLALWNDLQAVLDLQLEGFDMTSTDANIHDILAQCAVTVSFNSAVALEGFLHHKPAILFGRADFHQFCDTVATADQFPAALTAALSREQGYEKFLYWYFVQNCLAVYGANFETRAWGILQQAHTEMIHALDLHV